MKSVHIAALLLLLREKFPEEEFASSEDAPAKPIKLTFHTLDDTEVFLPSKLLTPEAYSYVSSKDRRGAQRIKKYRNPDLRPTRRVIKQP